MNTLKHNLKNALIVLIISFTTSRSSDDNSNSGPQINDKNLFIKAKIDVKERVFDSEDSANAVMSNLPINDLYVSTFEGIRQGVQGQGNEKALAVYLSSDSQIAEELYDEPEDLPIGFLHALISYFNIEMSANSGFVTDINNPASS